MESKTLNVGTIGKKVCLLKSAFVLGDVIT
jgi:hypothetical protein